MHDVAHDAIRLVRATGDADELDVGIENVLAVAAISDAIVDEQSGDDVACATGAKGHVLRDLPLPFAIAAHAIPRHGPVRTAMIHEPARRPIVHVVARAAPCCETVGPELWALAQRCASNTRMAIGSAVTGRRRLVVGVMSRGLGVCVL